jgi:hypothetical protein
MFSLRALDHQKSQSLTDRIQPVNTSVLAHQSRIHGIRLAARQNSALIIRPGFLVRKYTNLHAPPVVDF